MSWLPYPGWICSDCGDRYGRGWPKGHRATFHDGTCDVCGKEATVTEPRDYGHMREGWRELFQEDQGRLNPGTVAREAE